MALIHVLKNVCYVLMVIHFIKGRPTNLYIHMLASLSFWKTFISGLIPMHHYTTLATFLAIQISALQNKWLQTLLCQ